MKLVQPALLFYTLGVYIFYPLMQQIIFDAICKTEFDVDHATCVAEPEINSQVQSKAAKYGLYLNLATTVPSLVLPILMSMNVNRLGAQIMLILPFIGEGLTYTISLIFQILLSKSKNIPLYVIILCLTVADCMGSYGTARAIMNNYVSDAFDYKARQFHFQSIEIVNSIACTLSGIIGGYIVEYFSFKSGLALCIVLNLCTFFCLIFIEKINKDDGTNKRRREKKTSEMDKKLIDAEECKEKENSSNEYERKEKKTLCGRIGGMRVVRDLLNLPQNEGVWVTGLLVGDFFNNFAEYGALEIIVIYSMRSEFRFDPSQIGWLLSANHFIKAIGTLVIYQVLMNYCRMPMWGYSLINQLLSIGYPIFLCMASDHKWLISASVFLVLQGGLSALLMNTLSNVRNPRVRKFVFGLDSTISDLGAMLGSIAANSMYSSTQVFFPQLTFIVTGTVMFIGCGISTVSFFFLKRIKHDNLQAIELMNDKKHG